MRRADTYLTLNLEVIRLSSLDAEEHALVDELVQLQERVSEWTDYANAYMPKVAALYTPRGLSRREITKTPVWKIAQDLSGRLMVQKGLARAPDYRDKLEAIIRERFPNRRAFCEATGISEDMLSHVLARRKHLAIDTLSEALEKIGYELSIAPIGETKS